MEKTRQTAKYKALSKQLTKVDSRLLAMVGCFADAPNTGRAMLAGVHLCKHPTKGIYLVATNGHQMAVGL